MIIGVQAAYDSKIGFVFVEQSETFRETMGSVLAIHLMYEMYGNPESFWRPFLGIHNSFNRDSTQIPFRKL
jgi:hypothetical protein